MHASSKYQKFLPDFSHKDHYVLQDRVKKKMFVYCNACGMTVTEELIDLLKVLLTWQQSSWAGFERIKLDGVSSDPSLFWTVLTV